MTLAQLARLVWNHPIMWLSDWRRRTFVSVWPYSGCGTLPVRRGAGWTCLPVGVAPMSTSEQLSCTDLRMSHFGTCRSSFFSSNRRSDSVAPRSGSRLTSPPTRWAQTLFLHRFKHSASTSSLSEHCGSLHFTSARGNTKFTGDRGIFHIYVYAPVLNGPSRKNLQ